MAKFNVSCDLLVAVVLEIEAEDADAALNELHEMRRSYLLKIACTDDDSIGIANETVEPGEA